MSCFENYIGIKSCEITTPKSGKFLEDLGITINKLSGISNEATLTGVKYGTQKINEAINFVLADVIPDYTGVPVAGSLNDIGINIVDYVGSVKITSLCKDAKIRLDKIKANCQNNIDTILYIKDGSVITEIEFNTADEIYPIYKAKNKEIELYIKDVNYLPYNTLGSCEWVNNCCKDV
ncbi:MAG: hypothetical protein WD512_10030, partial [Candidatus Paceibacterota bacterium]